MASSADPSVEFEQSFVTTRSMSKVGKFSSSVSDEDWAVMGSSIISITGTSSSPTVATKLGSCKE
jgi:hypothetical protein